MGYSVTSKKVNITLNTFQQEQILVIWNKILFDWNSLNSQTLQPLTIKYMAEKISRNSSITKILDLLGFEYEEKYTYIKIDKLQTKLRDQSIFFLKVGDIITPGSYITLRGEDKAIFGWFFNGKMQQFNSYQELNELLAPFELKNKLDKSLRQKQTIKNMKI